MCGTNDFTVVTADITTNHIFMVWTRQTPRCWKTPPPIWTLWRTCLNRHTESSQQPSSPPPLPDTCSVAGSTFNLNSLIFTATAVTLVSYQRRVCHVIYVFPGSDRLALQLWHLGRNELGQLSLYLCIIQLRSQSLDSVRRNQCEKKKNQMPIKCTEKEDNQMWWTDEQRIVEYGLYCFGDRMWLQHWLRAVWAERIPSNVTEWRFTHWGCVTHSTSSIILSGSRKKSFAF